MIVDSEGDVSCRNRCALGHNANWVHRPGPVKIRITGVPMSASPGLSKALTQRQLRMIAIGGVIGAGLFVGSGVVMADTGPGAFITYALSGVLIIMVMRMLGEMAV